MATLNQGGPVRNRLMSYASQLRFPKLLLLTVILFGVDLIVPDLIPFVDEILLGLTAAMLGLLKDKSARGRGHSE
ncbi:MAG: DUF6116 family protein [Desulfatitalea sp.]